MAKFPTPKVGDKYALYSRDIFGPVKDRVTGPWYVTSVRGGVLSLGKENKPDPKAKRNWRWWEDGSLHSGGAFVGERCEPWSQHHEDAIRRYRRLVELLDSIDLHKKNNFEKINDEQLLTLVSILNAWKGEQHEGAGKEARADSDEG